MKKEAIHYTSTPPAYRGKEKKPVSHPATPPVLHPGGREEEEALHLEKVKEGKKDLSKTHFDASEYVAKKKMVQHGVGDVKVDEKIGILNCVGVGFVSYFV